MAKSIKRIVQCSRRQGVLINTAKSFVYVESGLKGVLMASRLSGLSPNLTSCFTPCTLISSYEVFEVCPEVWPCHFERGMLRTKEHLRSESLYKNGMIFQPEPGVYEKVHQIDFNSCILRIS
jgi:DNA polymerase I